MFDRMNNPDFRTVRRVRWSDTDLSGTVHFANYVRFMEETEYEFLRSRGLNVVITDEKGEIGFPRISTTIDITQPATFEDLLTVWMKVASNDGVQLAYEFEITSETYTVVARGRFEVACCRFLAGELPRAILIPDFFVERIGGLLLPNASET